MEYKRTTAAEGVGFSLITDKKFKTDVTYVSFRCGDGVKNAAYASLLTGVLSRCNEKYPSLYLLNRRLDALYDAHLECDVISVGFDNVPFFYVRSLNNRYSYDGTDIRKGSLEVLYDTLLSPKTERGLLSPSDTEGEKQQLYDYIKGIKNDPGAYADRQCLSFLFKDDTRFSPRCGTPEAADAADAASLTDFYRDMIKNAPVEIVCVSDEPHPEFEEFAQALSSKLGGRPGRYGGAQNVPVLDRTVRTVEETKTRQGAVRIVCDTGDDPLLERAHILTLFTEIYAVSPVSRLFKNVRERLSLCYSCGADRYGGLHKLVVRADADSANLAACEDEMLRQLRLMREPVGESELEAGKRSVCEALMTSADSPNSTAFWYLTRALRGLDPIDRAEYAKKIASVTAEQIAEAAEAVKVEAVYTLKEARNDE